MSLAENEIIFPILTPALGYTMVYVQKVNNRTPKIHKIKKKATNKGLQINQAISVDMQYYKGIAILIS